MVATMQSSHASTTLFDALENAIGAHVAQQNDIYLTSAQ